MKTIDFLRRRVALLATSLFLASCGGGLALFAGGVGTGGTGIGIVTGFGSLVVDGNLYSSATAEYWQGNEQEESAQVSSLSVALGQQVQMEIDDQGNPVTVQVEPALIGRASEISANSLKVNGVTVRVNGDASAGPVTYYAALTGQADLSDGMKVEVHGLYGSDAGGPYILATRIAQLPATATATRVTGVVTQLDPATGSFQIGGLAVHFDATTTRLPTGATLANGELVNVWSPAEPSGGQLNASVIRVRSLQGMTGKTVISGLVTGLSGRQFWVSGILVNADDPALPAVAEGDYVVVTGLPDQATGKLVASDIAHPAAAVVELRGNITEYVDAGNFLVRGVAVDAASASVTGGALANGAYVEVRGTVQGNAVRATTVTVHASTPENATVEFDGIVGARAGDTFTLTLPDGTAYNVTLAANVGYENGTASQLVNGVRVEVEATRTATGLLAYGIEFKNLSSPSEADVYETSGVAYDVTATSFAVNGLTIQINGVDATGLVNGAKVEVHFTYSGGQYWAQEIEVDD